MKMARLDSGNMVLLTENQNVTVSQKSESPQSLGNKVLPEKKKKGCFGLFISMATWVGIIIIGMYGLAFLTHSFTPVAIGIMIIGIVVIGHLIVFLRDRIQERIENG